MEKKGREVNIQNIWGRGRVKNPFLQPQIVDMRITQHSQSTYGK